jgi:NDP-sugar pyrophosphorylase family protein
MRQLTRAGFTEFAVNAYHLHEKIADFAGKRSLPGQPPIYVSLELPNVLGTGGALGPLKPWISNEPFLVYNGDILSDLDFSALWSHHKSHQNMVTMSVMPNYTGKDRAIWVETKAGRNMVRAIAKEKPAPRWGHEVTPYQFACSYAVTSEFLKYIPERHFFDVIDAFNQALEDGYSIEAVLHDGYWADVGSPASLWKTHKDIMALPSSKRSELVCAPLELNLAFGGQTVLGTQSEIGAGVSCEGVVIIGERAKIGPGCQLKNCLIFPDTSIAGGVLVENKIVGPGFEIKL